MTRSLLASRLDELVLVSRVGEIQGRRTYTSIGAYTGAPGDLCVIVVGAAQLESVMDEAVRAGWNTFLVVTGQLDESQREYLRRRVNEGVTVWGPNCVGFVNTHRALRVIANDFSPSLARRQPRVAIVSQSGGASSSMATHCRRLGMSISHLVSVGEEVDIGVDDVLLELAQRDETDAILVFVEATRRPAGFLEALETCARRDLPVVISKVGRTTESRHVAQAHSGALVGDFDEFSAAATVRDAIVVDCLRDAAGAAAAATYLRRSGPLGRRLSFVTSSGGQGALACDLLAGDGLALARLDEPTLERLAVLSARALGAANPLDTADGGGTPSTLPIYLDAMTRCDGVDLAVLIHGGALYGELIVGELVRARAGLPPVALVWTGLPDDLRERCREHSMLVVDDLADLLRWVGLVAKRDRRRRSDFVVEPSMARDEDADSSGWATYANAVSELAEAGLTFPARIIVDTEDFAVDVTAIGGFPVVVKDANARGHKAKSGAVVTDISTGDSLDMNVRKLVAHSGAVVVEHQVEPGLDLMIAAREGDLGGCVSVGFGGPLADVLGNQVTVAADADVDWISDQVAVSVIGRVLRATESDGGRSSLAAIADVMAIVGQLIVGGRYSFVELNPVRVRASGATPCDAKVHYVREQRG